MRARAFHIALLLIGLAGRAAAADHVIAGDLLRLKDPANQAGRRFVFRAARDTGVGSTVGDPRVTGATLEVTGVGDGNGATGPIDLPAARWTGIGNPAGSKGYRYEDPTGTAGGVTRLVLKQGKKGGVFKLVGFALGVVVATVLLVGGLLVLPLALVAAAVVAGILVLRGARAARVGVPAR